jgi:hypothetical protein
MTDTIIPVDYDEFLVAYRSMFADLRALPNRRRRIPGLSPNMWTPDVLDVFLHSFGMVELSTGVWDVLGERPRRAKRGVGITVRFGTPDDHWMIDGWSRLVSAEDATVVDVRRVYDQVVDEATRHYG